MTTDTHFNLAAWREVLCQCGGDESCLDGFRYWLRDEADLGDLADALAGLSSVANAMLFDERWIAGAGRPPREMTTSRLGRLPARYRFGCIGPASFDDACRRVALDLLVEAASYPNRCPAYQAVLDWWEAATGWVPREVMGAPGVVERVRWRKRRATSQKGCRLESVWHSSQQEDRQ